MGYTSKARRPPPMLPGAILSFLSPKRVKTPVATPVARSATNIVPSATTATPSPSPTRTAAKRKTSIAKETPKNTKGKSSKYNTSGNVPSPQPPLHSYFSPSQKSSGNIVDQKENTLNTTSAGNLQSSVGKRPIFEVLGPMNQSVNTKRTCTSSPSSAFTDGNNYGDSVERFYGLVRVPSSEMTNHPSVLKKRQERKPTIVELNVGDFLGRGQRHQSKALGIDATCDGVSRTQIQILRPHDNKFGVYFECCANAKNAIGIIPYSQDADCSAASSQKNQLQLFSSKKMNRVLVLEPGKNSKLQVNDWIVFDLYRRIPMHVFRLVWLKEEKHNPSSLEKQNELEKYSVDNNVSPLVITDEDMEATQNMFTFTQTIEMANAKDVIGSGGTIGKTADEASATDIPMIETESITLTCSGNSRVITENSVCCTGAATPLHMDSCSIKEELAVSVASGVTYSNSVEGDSDQTTRASGNNTATSVGSEDRSVSVNASLAIHIKGGDLCSGRKETVKASAGGPACVSASASLASGGRRISTLEKLQETTSKNSTTWLELHPSLSNLFWRALSSAEPDNGASVLTELLLIYSVVPGKGMCKQIFELLVNGPTSEGYSYLDSNKSEVVYGYAKELMQKFPAAITVAPDWDAISRLYSRISSFSVTESSSGSHDRFCILQQAACALEYLQVLIDNDLSMVHGLQGNDITEALRTRVSFSFFLNPGGLRDSLKQTSKTAMQYLIHTDLALLSKSSEEGETHERCSSVALRCLKGMGKLTYLVSSLYCLNEGIDLASDDLTFLLKDVIEVELACTRMEPIQQRRLKVSFLLYLHLADTSAPLISRLVVILKLTKEFSFLMI